MKFKFVPLAVLFLVLGFSPRVLSGEIKEAAAQTSIPIGGNTFITKGGEARISDKGLSSWSEKSTIASVYFKTEKAGELRLSLRLKALDGKSQIKVSVEGKAYEKKLSNEQYEILEIATVKIKKPGYVKIDLQGISKTGSYYGEISDVIVEGNESLVKNLVYVKENSEGGFHFGRRGPSVHLQFSMPETEKDNIEWFYNEITVPKGQDVIGSYYMANGFSGGYFGIQVNSPSERRILFSIWSPYHTDDPKSIPDSMKIKLLKKGTSVYTGEFGNEGSGGQSFLRYPWKAGVTYAFLTRAQPNAAKKTTVFTSYFKDPGEKAWTLIASFERPQTNTRLKGLYSFLENFSPETGHIERHVNFGNQWAITGNGAWHEISSIKFTADNTAKKNFRKDYSGGVKDSLFYLRNCGFFNDFVTTNQIFTRTSTKELKPVINFDTLP